MTKIKTKTKGNNTTTESFGYDEFETEAISRLQKGDSLVGPDGILTGLIQRIVNAALSGEADAHIRDDKQLGQANRRNGYTEKKLDTELGPVLIHPPRDRAGRFEPQLVGKWERRFCG